jgi:tol-pal system protein YbgF
LPKIPRTIDARSADRAGPYGNDEDSMNRSTARVGFCFAACAIAISLLAVPAAAQSTQQVLDRMGRLERNVQDLQAKVYTGSGSGGGVPMTPQSAAQFEIRLQQLEQEVRGLTGAVEEFSFNLRRLEAQFERSQSDLEMRLQMGDAANENMVMGTAAPVAAAAPAPAPVVTQPQTQRRTLIVQGVPTSAPAATTTAATTAAATPLVTATAPGGATVLPQGAPAVDYNNAYALLQRADYSGAERAFGAFLAGHPNDPLAGNAQYWLAETFYVRENYHQAAIHFAEGYKNYPTGPKAAANLLKLGMSLGRLGKNDEACASLTELGRRFPDAPGNVQQYARTERQRLGCG